MPAKRFERSEQDRLDFAKVLLFYGLIHDTYQTKQKIVCPFHEDINPSMIVDLVSCDWFCFGCNLKGGTLKLIELIERQKGNELNDLSICRKLYRILNSEKHESAFRGINTKTKHEKLDYVQLYNEAYDNFHGLKKTNWFQPIETEEIEAKRYLFRRGITSETLRKVNCKVTYNKSYGIIFPMLDNGKFKGWVSRTMIPEIEKKRKYLYNKGFRRVNCLVGDYAKNVKSADLWDDTIVVVEGYFDFLKLRQFDQNRVVAILGWKISENQIEKLKKHGIKTVISALDNDDCGRKGTKYLKNFFEVVRLKYSDGIKDPGEMPKEQFDKCFRKTIQ